MAGELSPILAGVPVVASTTERDQLYPTPTRDQRVQIRSTGSIMRYDGTKWITDAEPPVSVMRVGGFGDGTHDDAANFNAAQAGAGTGGFTVDGDRTYRVSSNLFLTAPLTLKSGAVIKPDSGVSVFIEGPLTASIGKHFDLSAGGKVLFDNIAIPEVFPEWFGAAADGVTNDTAAIMAAIDSVAFNNAHLSSPVTLSGATYLFSAINLGGTAGGGNGVWLRGAGNYATTLLTTATSGVAISMNRPGCRLTDLRVQTSPSVTPGGTQYLIQSTTGNACRLERLELIKYYNGIAASGVTMDHVSLDYGLAGGIGIDLSDSIGSILNDVRVAARYNASACFLLQGVVGQPDTNEFTNCSTGADVPTLWATYGTTNTGAIGIATSVRMAKQVGGFQPRWNRFVGCLFETQTNSIGTTTFDYQAGQDTKIIGGYLYGGYYAFAMLGATAGYLNDHVLEGTIVFGAYINGIYHNPADTTNPAPLTLTDCTIVDNSQNAIGGWPGVNLGANSRGFTMRGGTCGNTTFQTVRQQFGVAVDAAAQDYLIDVDSIDFTGNVSGPVSGLVPTLASAATLAPVSQAAFVSGVAAIGNITAPRRFRTVTLIPTGLFTWTAAGNIAVAGSAVVGKALILRYVVATGKWYPSYTA